MHESQGCTYPFTRITRPKKISDSYKIYTTKSPKIYNICSKEKINKRFLQLTCIGKDLKTTESHTKHQLKNTQKNFQNCI
jgi:hypothetical protein